VLSFPANSDAIGDTIGGITAPIASMIGSILVFLALIEQVKANKIILGELHKKDVDLYITEHIKLLKDDLKDFSIHDIEKYDGSSLIGFQAIASVFDQILKQAYPREAVVDSMFRVKLIIERFAHLVKYCEKSGLEEDEYRALQALVAAAYQNGLYSILYKYSFNWEKIENKECLGYVKDIYKAFAILDDLWENINDDLMYHPN
jgi:hypothetical protein